MNPVEVILTSSKPVIIKQTGFYSHEIPEISKSMQMESRMVTDREEEMRFSAMRTEFQSGRLKPIDGGDSCKTMRTYLDLTTKKWSEW